MDLCQNSLAKVALRVGLGWRAMHRSTDMKRKASLAGGYVSTAERNGLEAIGFVWTRRNLKHGLLYSLPRAIAARRGGCMLYDNIAIFDRKQLSPSSHDAVFDNADFDMNPLLSAPTIPSSMR